MRTSAPSDDHDTGGRIDIDVLAMNAHRHERAVASWPPEVAVVDRRTAAERFWCRRLANPTGRQNRIVIRNAIAEDEQSEAAVVAQCPAETAAADLGAVGR